MSPQPTSYPVSTQLLGADSGLEQLTDIPTFAEASPALNPIGSSHSLSVEVFIPSPVISYC